ncbi:unnamed protein product [Cuscuta epithymum]|uniref:Uncharacterized protein n=1 Tax=Cuscuta epithymum TaxID=186058 RepID=A0AAV0DCX5_9ASTE|nr:unnamed protein product [Cuscuta epithymum]
MKVATVLNDAPFDGSYDPSFATEVCQTVAPVPELPPTINPLPIDVAFTVCALDRVDYSVTTDATKAVPLSAALDHGEPPVATCMRPQQDMWIHPNIAVTTLDLSNDDTISEDKRNAILSVSGDEENLQGFTEVKRRKSKDQHSFRTPNEDSEDV